MKNEINFKTPYISEFIFYDSETSGVNTSWDQMYQAAGIRTNSDLDIIPDTQFNLLCKPRLDVIPHPKAFLTHMIDIDVLKKEGMSEFELTRQLNQIFTLNGNTAISGYNSMNFDDSLVRNMNFRNMQNIYSHEWKNNNRRFDVFKVVQMAFLHCPEVLNWPKSDSGGASLKLDRLAPANGITHDSAHDALEDVIATIELARILKSAHPRLWNYCLQLTDKNNAINLLAKREPVIEVSGLYGKDNGLGSLVLPMIMDLNNKNKMITVDLRVDPEDLLQMSAEDIQRFTFTKRTDLNPGDPVTGVGSIAANTMPLITSMSKLNPDLAQRMNIDIDQCMRNYEKLKSQPDLLRNLQLAVARDFEPPSDAFESIYSGGFLTPKDDSLRCMLSSTTGGFNSIPNIVNQSTKDVSSQSSDADRNYALMNRCKWNNFYKTLLANGSYDPQELSDFSDYLSGKIFTGTDGGGYLNIEQFNLELDMTKSEMPLNEHQLKILDSVESHVADIKRACQSIEAKSKLIMSNSPPPSDHKKDLDHHLSPQP
jgi:exodeoxyribonuclease-1